VTIRSQARIINVLMAYGRCLRPALYSSLRSSPSHPTGVSALRVTIAIANARFARKQWGLRESTAKSRRLFSNESATSRRVRAGAIGGSTAMTRTAFCRKSLRAPRVSWLGSWVLGISDSRPTYGKIKIVPPRRRQAIGTAGLLAGASVGARAARRRKTNKFSTVSSTGPRIASGGSADEPT
jgi:hypothetical protein